MNTIDFLPGDVVFDQSHPRILGLVTEITRRGPSVVWEHGGRAVGYDTRRLDFDSKRRWRFQVPREAFHESVQIRELVVSTALRDAGLQLGMRRGWNDKYELLAKGTGLKVESASTCSVCRGGWKLGSKIGVTTSPEDTKAAGQLFLRVLSPEDIHPLDAIIPGVAKFIRRANEKLLEHPATLAGCTDFWMCVTCGSWMEATPLQVLVRDGKAKRHDRSERG